MQPTIRSHGGFRDTREMWASETVNGRSLRVNERLNRKKYVLGKEKVKGNISEKRAGQPICIHKKYSIWRPLKIKKISSILSSICLGLGFVWTQETIKASVLCSTVSNPKSYFQFTSVDPNRYADIERLLEEGSEELPCRSKQGHTLLPSRWNQSWLLWSTCNR